MTVESVVRIKQYAPSDGTRDLLDKLISSEGNLTVLDTVGASGANTSVQHLRAITNPSPYGVRTSIYTGDPDAWGDSPDNDPSRPDKFRYAYGRFGTRYGNLDSVGGVIINERDFSREGTYSQTEVEFSGDTSVRDFNYSCDGTLSMQEHERITGDTTINQYSFIVSASPIPFSYKNSIDTDVSIRLSNYVLPLSSGTVTLSLDSEMRAPLEVIPFYSGLGGFDAKWYNDREFDYNHQVFVEWRVFDTDSPPNEIVFRYWFRTVPDSVGPRISGVSPADNSSDIPVDTCVSFTVRDYEKGVNIDTLELYVNNIYVSAEELTITQVSTVDGYTVRYCPPQEFLYGDEVPVSVYVKDLADEPNFLFYVYSFTTESSMPPRVLGHLPRACRKYIPVDTDISVDVVDGGQGLDEGSLRIDVDDNSVGSTKRPIIYRED